MDADLSSRIEEWNQQPLTPAAYCQFWVAQKKGMQPGIWGYRKACIAELHRVLGISTNTVNCWGTNFEKCSDVTTLLHLRRVHVQNVQMSIISSLQKPVTGTELIQRVLQQLESIEQNSEHRPELFSV